MSELLKRFGAPSEPIEESADFREPVASSVEAAEASTLRPVLITEQEVLFGTAAAVPAAAVERGRRWTAVIGAALQRMFLTSTTARATPRHYPKRHVWLENALMAREMDRL